MKSIKGFQTNNVQNIRDKKIYVFGSKSTHHEKSYSTFYLSYENVIIIFLIYGKRFV